MSYISAEEKAKILEAIINYLKDTHIISKFWEETIKPDMAKLLIDCLRHYGKIKDDTPDYVKSIKITSCKGKKDSVKIIVDN